MEHVVQRGETLRKIAAAYGTSLAQIIAANPDLADPDRIAPGQRLRIPSHDAEPVQPAPPTTKEPQAQQEAATYEVRSGDTLKRIAAHHGVALRTIIDANPDIDPDRIFPGQTLLVPTTTPTSTQHDAAQVARRAARPTRRTPPSRDWSGVSVEERVRYVIERLVGYGYPIDGAAGIVGNLFYESGVLPNRIQGSSPDSPMRSRAFDGHDRDFTAEEVMRRNAEAKRGPELAGIGLAQWTSPSRRQRLFEHEYDGEVLGAQILDDMDAQVDYLVTELRSTYVGVESVVADPQVGLEDATDEVLYNFEIPASILGDDGKLPRTDPAVERVFLQRRTFARRAREMYRQSQPD